MTGALNGVVASIWDAEQHEPTLTGLLAEVIRSSPEFTRSMLALAGIRVPGKTPSAVPVAQQVRLRGTGPGRRPDIILAFCGRVFIIEAKAGPARGALKQARSYVSPVRSALLRERARHSLRLDAIFDAWDRVTPPIPLVVAAEVDDVHVVAWRDLVLALPKLGAASNALRHVCRLPSAMKLHAAGAPLDVLGRCLALARTSRTDWADRRLVELFEQRKTQNPDRVPDTSVSEDDGHDYYESWIRWWSRGRGSEVHRKLILSIEYWEPRDTGTAVPEARWAWMIDRKFLAKCLRADRHARDVQRFILNGSPGKTLGADTPSGPRLRLARGDRAREWLVLESRSICDELADLHPKHTSELSRPLTRALREISKTHSSSSEPVQVFWSAVQDWHAAASKRRLRR